MKKCIICNSETHKFLFTKEKVSYVKCKNCGLIFLNPQTSYKIIKDLYKDGEAYWRDYKHNILNGVDFSKKASNFYIELIQENIFLTKEMKVLDVGCGIGVFLNQIKPFVKEVKGIDLSEWTSKFSKEKYGIDILVGDILKLNLPKNYFDIITMWQTLEHVKNPKLIIEKIKAILRPDGYIIIGTPSVNCLFAKILGRKWNHFHKEHLFLFSPKTITMLLTNLNLCIINIEKFAYSRETEFSNILGFLKMVANRGIKNIINYTRIPINFGPFQTNKWKDNLHLLDMPKSGLKDGMIVFSKLGDK